MKQILRIADKKILINTEFHFEITEKFKRYTYDSTDYDIKYSFINSNEYIEFKNKPIYENVEYKIYEENNKIYRVFYQCDCKKPYACLLISRNDINNYTCYLYPRFTKHRLSISNLFDVMALEYAMIKLDTLILHSSFICYNNIGILFSAPSGTGKSTQADLWKEYKSADIINGDRSFLNKCNGRWVAHGSPYSGSSNIFKNESYDIKSVVLLKQGLQNKIGKANMNEAYKFLIKEITINYWDIDFYNKGIDLLLDLINNTEIYVLECLPNKEAVDLLEETLEGVEYEY